MSNKKISKAEAEAIKQALDLVEGPVNADSGQVVVCKVAGGGWAWHEHGCDAAEISDQLRRGEEPKPTCPRCHKLLRRSGDAFFQCNCGN